MKKSKLIKQMVAGGYMSNTKQKRLTNNSNSNTNNDKKQINKLKQNNYTK